MTAPAPETSLCTECALCCDGSLFRGAPVEAGECARLEAIGFEVRATPRGLVFEQPCARLCDLACSVYPERPAACSDFACKLLKRVRSGEASLDGALEIVASARALRDRIAAREDGAATVAHRLGDDHLPPLPDATDREGLQAAVEMRLERVAFDALLDREFRQTGDTMPASED